MWVKAITPFFGAKEERYLRRGEVFQVSKDRGEGMISRGLAVERESSKKPSEDKAQRPTENKVER